MFPKQKRIEDEGLLEQVRLLPCIACCAPPPSDAHHITTRGAGGHDLPENVISLCREHHNEWHSQGGLAMSRKYRGIRFWLEAAERTDIYAPG